MMSTIQLGSTGASSNEQFFAQQHHHCFLTHYKQTYYGGHSLHSSSPGSTGASKEQFFSQSTTPNSGNPLSEHVLEGQPTHMGLSSKLQKVPSGQKSAIHPRSTSKEQFFSQSTTASSGFQSNSGGHSSHLPLGQKRDSGGHSSHSPRSPR